MKPHIFKRNGLWHCRIILDIGPIGRGGIGYTPLGAYEDWLKA